MSKPMTVRGVLLAAARLLHTRPWYPGADKQPPSGGRAICALDAIIMVTPGDQSLRERACTRFQEHIRSGITRWNDAEGRTKREVVAALRKAATK